MENTKKLSKYQAMNLAQLLDRDVALLSTQKEKDYSVALRVVLLLFKRLVLNTYSTDNLFLTFCSVREMIEKDLKNEEKEFAMKIFNELVLLTDKEHEKNFFYKIGM